ncbi:uncharacterized protein LOC123524063 [Mercenaria mercenaria]|uniref:uncharacterized protein LOC123524063 n=1 Tax=Mercenaria mercenaria TaxID=6596 RepID=UPI00234E9554|nr:uncharacterized protein LOC123524063 [Mercenaria mercenaria]
MGTPVSKTDKFSVSDNTSGTLNEKDKKETTGILHNDERTEQEKSDGSSRDIPKSPGKKNDVTQMLCAADDDDIDEQEWGDIYKRLKTNCNNDLHILNTRFNRNDIQTYPDGSVRATGPIFTSTVAERPTRINSANYNPHAVVYERDKSRIKTAIGRNTEIMEDESSDENENSELRAKSIGTKGIYELGPLQHGLGSVQSKEEDRANSNYTEDNFDLTKNSKPEKIKEHLMFPEGNGLLFQTQTCLDIPNDNRRVQSPTPKSAENDGIICDDDDIDPFEGLDIPRQRVYSFGSASIYSVKEISDDLYQQYRTEIKNCIRSYGFFEAFPSPSIVSEAQKIYRRLDIPSPVDEDGNVLPHPPKITKSEYLATETNALEEAREKIQNMPESLLLDGETVDIVHYLCDGLDDDMRKLTMLSTWIVFWQFQRYGSQNNKPETQDECCRQFRTMCKFARIKTKLVKGIIRGPSYVPGDDPNLNHGNWLAVMINYVWLLVDPFIHQDTLAENAETYQSPMAEIDENLFDHVEQMFQDPEDFIFSHYPDEEYWQLLARPVTKAELPDLAVLRPGFFAFGMTVSNSPKAVIVVKTAETVISLAFHEESMLQFKCCFQICDYSMSSARARTYVFLETILKSHKIKVRVRFPKTGSYILDIAGSPDGHLWQNVISYKLVYEGEHFSKPFPANPREEWGPGLDTFKLGLTPLLYHSGEILMQNGVIQIAFHDEKRLKFEHVMFKEDVHINPDALKVSILKDRNNDVIFVVDIDTKVTGLFTLQLSARADPRAEFTNFCNYLISKEKKVVIPKLKFSDKSFSTDEKDPLHAPENGKLHLTVGTTGLIQLTVELKLHDRQELNLSDHAMHWIDENSGYIDLNFPRNGKYTLKVLGREVNKGRFRTIREDTIQVSVPSEKWSCFPKVGSSWNSWYKIESPLSHHLEEKEDITFKVNVKNALDVAVVSANGWYHLDRVGESWLWVGQVWTGPKSTRCRLLARFDIGSDKWSDLLLFKIMSEEDFERMEERQNSAREKAYNQKTVENN